MITTRHIEKVENAKFSILIPTWNNLDFLKLCVSSILKNSHFTHQIIIHVNDGSDGTLEWVRENKFSYTHSKENIGVCWAMNAMRPLVQTNYIFFLNDDMYVCPYWDLELWKEIESLPDNMFYLSSTQIQPRKFWCKSIISPVDIGRDIKTFDEKELLKHYMNIPHGDWCGATWPPTIIHRDLWDLVGGYSVEFSPGMYSDPDFSAKLYLAGVRYFKGIDKSRVYHFEAKSTKRIKKNKGSKQFLYKWGITSSSFMSNILHRGKKFPYNKHSKLRILFSKIRSRIKQIFWTLTPMGNAKNIWEI
mgnify:CR=1 FL=1